MSRNSISDYSAFNKGVEFVRITSSTIPRSTTVIGLNVFRPIVPIDVT